MIPRRPLPRPALPLRACQELAVHAAAHGWTWERVLAVLAADDRSPQGATAATVRRHYDRHVAAYAADGAQP